MDFLPTHSKISKTVILFTLGIIFSFWFLQGYFITLWVDPMRDISNITILMQFPETLWNPNVTTTDLTSIDTVWHTARWTADIVPYLSYQVVGKLYNFFSGDPVTAVYVTTGFYTAIIYTALAWILSLYTATKLNMTIYHKKFIFILFFCGILPFLTEALPYSVASAFHFTRYSTNPNNISVDINYVMATTLMLVVFYPYWEILHKQEQWDRKYNTLSVQFFYYLLIFLTAFSTNAMSALFFVAQALVGITLFLGSPIKPMTRRIRAFLVSPPIHIQALYIGCVLCLIALLSEKVFGYSDNIQAVDITNLITHIKDAIKLSVIYSIPFILIYGYILFFYKYQKVTYLQDKLQNNLLLAIFSHLWVLCYIVLFLFARNYWTFLYAYKNPVLIIISLNVLMILFHFLTNIKSPFLYAFLFIFCFSRYIFFFPHYPNNSAHLREYKYFQTIHKQDTQKEASQLVINSFNTDLSQEWLPVLQRFLRYTEIIDYDTELIYQAPITKK